METNNKYSERQGEISGSHMEGKAWNVQNRKWTWLADYQNLPASMANVMHIVGLTPPARCE